MLTATDLWYGYDARAPVVRGISLTVPSSGTLGILGPNGSGKTTLLRLLAGTRQPDRGSVTLNGEPLARHSRAHLAQRMAVVPQETQLAFDYTVREVAMMGRYPHLRAFEIEGPLDLERVDEALAATGTLHLRARQFNTLSGGEKQRVVIASALAQVAAPASGDFRVLLLDEPTASLDLGYQVEVVDLLQRLQQERGLSIVISTHDLHLASILCDRIVLIRDGQMLATGTPDDVITPERIRALYDVEAEVIVHASGQRIVLGRRRLTR